MISHPLINNRRLLVFFAAILLSPYATHAEDAGQNELANEVPIAKRIAPDAAESEQTPPPGQPLPMESASARPLAMPDATEGVSAELPPARAPIEILGATVQPGTSARLSWSVTQLFEGVPVTTPVLVIHGNSEGPTLCLTAALHGDELNGIEIVRRIMHEIKADRLSGTIIGVPIVNVQGFRRGDRYLPDRRDLNRYFPGNPNGSAASRIAYSLFNQVIRHCDSLVDLHTGSFERTNLPQLRADLRNPAVISLAQGFGSTVVIHGAPAVGTLRYAASKAGIPSVTLEAGGPSQLELEEVKHGVKGIETLLTTLGMVRKLRFWGEPEPIYYRSSWVRASRGGILLADVNLGSTVHKGDVLGTITDPMTNAMTEVLSPYAGRVIGMARNQVVMPGFATFHIGIQTDEPPVPTPNDLDNDVDGEEESRIMSGLDDEDETEQNLDGPNLGDDDSIDGTNE